jgi:hypothetical protein
MSVEDPASHARSALSKAMFGNSHYCSVVGYLDHRRSETVTVRVAAKATGLADAIVKPIFERLVDSGALVPHEDARPRRAFTVDADNLEPIANAAAWIATKVELELADVETRLWELAERDLGSEGVQVLRRLAIRVPSAGRLSWLANAIADTTHASMAEVNEIVSAAGVDGTSG